MLNVEIAAISKYETGRVQLKEDYIKILSDFFDVNSDFLLGNSNSRKKYINADGTLIGKVASKIEKMDDEELELFNTIIDKITKDKN